MVASSLPLNSMQNISSSMLYLEENQNNYIIINNFPESKFILISLKQTTCLST